MNSYCVQERLLKTSLHKMRVFKALLIASVLLLSACAGNSGPGANTLATSQLMTSGDTARYQEALKQLAQGNPQQAEGPLRALVAKYPTDAGLVLNLATSHYQNGDLEQAVHALNEAERLNSELPHIHNLRGLMAVQSGEFQTAEQHYLTAIGVDAQHAYSHYNLALLYDIFYQDISAALPYYQRYLALTGSDDTATANWARQIESSLAQESRR